MYEISPALIKERAAIFVKNDQWTQRLDASHFKLYTALRRTLRQRLAPLTPALNDMRAAFNQLPKDNLSEETTDKLFKYFASINQTLESVVANTVQYSLMSYGMMMPSELTTTAAQFKQALWSPMYTIFSYFTMAMEPANDACITKVLSQFVPTYEPYAYQMLARTDKIISSFSVTFADLSTYIQTAVIEVRSFNNRLSSCGKSASRQLCIDQLVSLLMKISAGD